MKKDHSILDYLYSLEVLIIILLCLFVLFGKNYTDKILFERMISQNYYEGIYYNEFVDSSYLEVISKALSKNDIIYESFKKDGGNIYYIDNYEGYIRPGQSVSGYFISFSYEHRPLIELKNGFEDCLEKTTTHELGHYLDYKLKWKSLRPEFIKLYKKYKDINLNGYGINENHEYIKGNIREFFAERYADYILYPDILKEIEPEIYEYIDKCYKEVASYET